MRFPLSAAVALFLVALITAFFSAHSAFVFLWWGAMAAVGHRLLWRERNVGSVLFVYVFYSLLAVIIYKTQLWTNPTYYGFSGGLGVGTDDSFFWSLVAYDIPHDFPQRFAVAVQHHPYADLLSVLVGVHRRVFPQLHPLDLLYFNTFGLSFFPFLVRAVYRQLFQDDRGNQWAFGMSLIAPYVLANGVILMRDGLVATTFTGGLMAVQQRRWRLLGFFGALTAWLRPENGIMLALMAVVLLLADSHLDPLRMGWRRPDSKLRLTLQGTGLMILALVAVQVVFQVAWWEALFRGDFLRNIIGQGAAVDSGTSTFYALSQLPLPLRIPLTLLFYLGSPFLALGALKTKGLWVPRTFLTSVFALLFPIYAAWFYRGVMRILRAKHTGALIFLFLFLVNLSLVTQASMQLRHKIPLQGMFYVVVAYGITTPYVQDRSLGWLIALSVVLLNVVFNLLQLVGG